jgi:CelD/BcsL family acetyltransferase involved in cellulose biosynthesis
LAFGEEEADEICSDYLNLIIRKGEEAAVITKILDYLTNDLADLWDEIVLDDIWGDSENILHLKKEMAMRPRLTYQEAHKSFCYYMSLPKSSDLFWAERSNDFKKKYRYYLKRLSAKGKVSYQKVSTLEALESGIAALANLHQKRWEDQGKPGVFASERFLMFHQLFSKIALKNGWLSLRFLSLDENPIAAIYSFAYQGKVSFYQSGISTQMNNEISLGTLMLAHCVEESIADGMAEYDFLRGSDSYKKSWAKTVRELTTVRIFLNKGNVKVVRAMESLMDALRKVYRRFK